MELWQQLIVDGNECFEQREWLEAENYYYLAENVIAKQWQQDLENTQLLLAWVASLHNLSALFEAQGESQAALRYLTMPHHRLLTMLQQRSLSENFEMTMYRAIKVTLMPLLEFSQRHPICDDCLAQLQLTKQWLLNSQPTLH